MVNWRVNAWKSTGNMLVDFNTLCEATLGDIKRKGRSVKMLFPTFDDRVKNVQLMGGIRLKDVDDDNWHFSVHSGTKKDVWYDCTLHFKNIQEVLERYVKDRRLWVENRSRVDLKRLAAAFIEKVDVQVFCSCPSDLYHGFQYIRGRAKYDAKYTDPEYRPPTDRNPYQYGSQCKHLSNVMKALPFYVGTIAKWLRDFYARDIAGYEKEAMKEFGWVKKAAATLGKRKARIERKPPKAPEKKPEAKRPRTEPEEETQPETEGNTPPNEPENERITESGDIEWMVSKQPWGKTSDDITVYIVDGEYVRNNIDVEFTEGGHDLRYNFIPEREVWIENMRDPAEHKFNLLHELHERHLMNDNGLDYETAHEDSSRIETYCRKNPKSIDSMLTTEGWKRVNEFIQRINEMDFENTHWGWINQSGLFNNLTHSSYRDHSSHARAELKKLGKLVPKNGEEAAFRYMSITGDIHIVYDIVYDAFLFVEVAHPVSGSQFSAIAKIAKEVPVKDDFRWLIDGGSVEEIYNGTGINELRKVLVKMNWLK